MRKVARAVRIIILLLSIAASYLCNASGQAIPFMMAYMFFLLFFTYCVMTENYIYVKGFLKTRRDSTCMNEHEIIRKNMLITGVCSAVVCILMYIGSFLQSDVPQEAAKLIGVWILRLVLLVFFAIGWLADFLLVKSRYEVKMPDSSLINKKFQGNDIHWDRIVGFVFLILLFLYFLYSVIHYLRRAKIRKLQKSTEESFEDFEAVSEYSERKREVKDNKIFTNKEIRQMYRNGMRNMVGRGKRLSTSTPNEQRESACENGYQVSQELTEVYEKARYTGELSTKDEVRHMKELIKNAERTQDKK